ncbi:MAG: hypothetical protein E6J37_08060 [Chloroflexi bacterium]|nr:MAG: hypothetical protein E6J37_08060 [Chloroflexota bacterium]
MIDLGSSTCTGAAQVNSEPGIGDGVGPGVGVGEATVGTGVGLGDGEDWATGRAALPHAERISASARTATFMQAITPARNLSYGPPEG